MSDYVIKKYEKGIEEEQAKLGTEMTSEWTDFGQTPAERLKEYYSAEGFDPDTRLYAFKDDKLVGFIVSRVLPDTEDGIKRAQHDFPLAIDNNEEVGKLLYNKAVEVLKEKGVKVLEARVGSGWGNTLKLAEKLGYKEARIFFVRSELAINKIKTKPQSIFVDFDPEKDKDILIKFYMEQFNFTEEQAIANYEGIIAGEGGFTYCQLLHKEEGKIVARGLVVVPNEDPKTATLRPLAPVTDNFESYLSKAAEFAKGKGAEKIQMYFGGPQLEQLDFYEKKGFEVQGKFYIYEKEI
ncbi:MAG: GNAT family N-acetyltransferase [Asgard group archaeon]|nr:GNAT family N-acetyltransferase [Asgard group archaeon]